jgi:HAD superfamily phosphatase
MPQHLPSPDVFIFDMDGVLAEVTASYRETIVSTVRHFTGHTVTSELIQTFKNAGGWNNDWELSHRFIADLGHNVDYNDVVNQFNRIFLGHGSTPGLIGQESWIPKPGLLEALSETHPLGIFTGRLRYELTPTLARFVPHLRFHPTVTADEVTHPKPAPDGLQQIQAYFPSKTIWYFGDTVDDARSARDAQVPFFGIASPDSLRRDELISRLYEYGALRVIPDINELMVLLKETEAAVA